MTVEVASVDETAKILGCSRRRVFQLLADGVLERAVRYGRQIRILRASIDRALTPATPKTRAPRRQRSDSPAFLRPAPAHLLA